MRASTFSVQRRTTSGFVRQSWVLTLRRRPFTSEKYSGCASNHASGGRRRLNVWHMPRTESKRNRLPPSFASKSRRLSLLRAANARPSAEDAPQFSVRRAKAGRCVSSRSPGTEKAARAGTTSKRGAYHAHPPKRSSSS